MDVNMTTLIAKYLNFLHFIISPLSECDQRILSTGESFGTISSPNYPHSYPTGVRCVFYIDGLFDRENLEVAKITFTDLNIPSSNDAK